jgi:hypothetical protein
MKERLPLSVHQNIYLTGLIFLALGMIYSGPVASISIMLLALNWFLEGNYKSRVSLFLRNKIAVILSLVFAMHLIGLCWSSDLTYGLDDVRTKIPLFVLPFIISTSKPLRPFQFKLFLGFFITGVFVSTVISFCVLLGWLPFEVKEVRDISIYISHIRLSLMICLSVFILAYFLLRVTSARIRILFFVTIIWFVAFLVVLESLTGLGILGFAFLLASISRFNARRPVLSKLVLALAFGSLCFASYHIYSIGKSFLHQKKPDPASFTIYTPSGRPYTCDINHLIVENGIYVSLQICWPELEEGWEKKSKIPFHQLDPRGSPIELTLIRYMASKGFLNKDGDTFSRLTNEDIRNIENGVTNCRYPRLSSLNSRIYETLWEFDVYWKGYNPSGNSMTMRFEFWKAGFHIFKNHILCGVGTGDVKDAFHKQYRADNSLLDERWQLRGHNQFLAIAIAFGIPGLCLFLFSLVYPLYIGKNYKNYFYLVFWIIAVLSMVTEDTLETQAGVTFYALFNSLLLFSQPIRESDLQIDEITISGKALL